MSFLGGIGMQFLGGMLSGNAERKRQARLLALQRQRHFDAYALATQETPEAIKYRNRLLDRATEGDPDIGKRQRMMIERGHENSLTDVIAFNLEEENEPIEGEIYIFYVVLMSLILLGFKMFIKMLSYRKQMDI